VYRLGTLTADWPLASLSVTDVIGVVGTALFAVVGLFLLPRLWRDELPRWPEKPPAWWLWGGPLYRGWVRAHAAAVLGCVMFLLVAGVLALTPEQPDGPFVRPAWVVVPCLAALGSCLLVMLCILLFNRPKVLVAPRLRHQQGVVGEWLAAWRRRRDRDRRRAAP